MKTGICPRAVDSSVGAWAAGTKTVRDAFETMHKAHLNGLPIIDAEHSVIGYLDQLELLMVWVRASGHGPLLRPSKRDA